jgi:hypothetical protein
VAHPTLWQTLAEAYPSLLAVTNGLRIFTTVLAGAIVIWWWSSAWRCMIGRPGEGDHHRAGLVPIAIAVLLFEFRWFLPLTELQRGQILVVAHGGMALALLFGIYVHGRQFGGLRIRRAMVVYGGMLALCIGVSMVLR